MEFAEIINNSESRLNKLKILSNFYDNSLIIHIAVRTRVIHDIFASNETLDTNKLELFHLQFTDSLIDLLNKLKKNLEQKFAILTHEIRINEDIMESFKGEIEKDSFKESVITHNLIMQSFMEMLYKQLAYETNALDLELMNAIDGLVLEKGIEYYRKLEANMYQKILELPLKKQYDFQDFTIEKKLLGKLNIQDFKFKFLCGFQFENKYIEVYEFIHSEEHFVYIKSSKTFVSIKLSDFPVVDFSKNVSNKKEVLLQLKQKNVELKTQSELVLKSMPADVEQVLNDYLGKISAIDFLDDLQKIDEQTNILRTMLNINIK